MNRNWIVPVFLALCAFPGAAVAAVDKTNQPPAVPEKSPKSYAEKTKRDCDCTCGEKTYVGNDCVSFFQNFGRTPRVEGAPTGRLSVLEYTSARLPCGVDVLRFDHPMMRRIIDIDEPRGLVSVEEGDGWVVDYVGGIPARWSTGADLALRKDPDGHYVEQLPDRTLVHYNSDNAVEYLITPQGIRLDRSNWDIDIVRSGFALAQVWSLADGLMDIERIGGSGFKVSWYPPARRSAVKTGGRYTHEGLPAKTFVFGYARENARHVYRLHEHRDEQFNFDYVWTSRNGRDWEFVRGGDGLFAVDRKESSIVDGIRRTLREFSVGGGNAVGEVLYESVGLRGATVVGRAFIGADGAESRVYSAVRIEEGRAAGRLSSVTNEFGGATEYFYDDQARTVCARREVFGHIAEETLYSYADALADGFVDRRVRRAVVRRDGVAIADTAYEYVDDDVEGRIERETRTDPASGRTLVSARYRYPASSANPAERGRLRLAVASDLTAAQYAYEAHGSGYRRFQTRGRIEDGRFLTVDGKSTRQIDTFDFRGDIVRTERHALVGGEWRLVDWQESAYNLAHKLTGHVNSRGESSASEWICTGPVWRQFADGTAISNTFDRLKRIAASERHSPLGMVRTEYGYDAKGRIVRETTITNGAVARVESASYDERGRKIRSVDPMGNATVHSYSRDGRTETVVYPDGGTRITALNCDGSIASVTGTAVTPGFYSYGVTTNGLAWTCVRYGRADSPRYVKTFENALGETVRREQPSFGEAMIVTENSFNDKGQLASVFETGRPAVTNVYDELGDLARRTESADGAERTVETTRRYALVDDEVWLGGTQTFRTSDAAIAPLVTESWSKVSGLTLDRIADGFTVDARGNTNRTWSALDPTGAKRTSWTQLAGIGKVAFSESVDGATVRTVSHSAVTNTIACDAFRRQLATTDGRGNTTSYAYDASGRLTAVTDAATNTTCYAYDAMGRLVAATNALGNVTRYEYDLRGNKTYEGGATYPVRYAYDIYGNKIAMTTYRDESSGAGDTTNWLYDEALNCMTNKLYADGKGPSYDYDAYGRLVKRTWARGIETTYAYDGWNNLTNTVYSDETPSVVLQYDALGRQTQAIDAAGTTTFAYDDFGSLTNETVVGVAGTNTIERFTDAFGRDAGYALNGVRQTTLGYDPTTGRLATMLSAGSETPFTWNYLAGSDLKQSLTYPNGLAASWQYDANNQLLQVCNAFPTNVISQYDYTYDAAGCRIGCDKSGSAFMTPDTYAYRYNARSELTNAMASVDAAYNYGYAFDDIGNRESSSERGTNSVYAANQLNQYTAVDDFTPEFDDDGNQTLVKTATGVWQVCYNAEDRPVLWTSGITNIVMSFDHMGRRTEYLETTAAGTGVLHLVATNIHHRFVYDGYICVRRLVVADEESSDVDFVWDPTEPAATRTLVIQQNGGDRLVVAHDGGKNVTELLFLHGSTAAHYEYSPFGELVGAARVPFPVGVDFYAINPFRFSSEYYDCTLGLVYYNYRHYSPSTGRWLSREKAPLFVNNSYAFLDNVANSTDMLGLYDVLVHYYLIYALMRELGYTDAQAQEIAAGSQYPDTREWDAVGSEWDAVYERFRPNTQRLEYRELFHNLNSSDCCGILAFRRCLAEKIDKEETLFLKGVYLHTLADTYAHLDPSTMCSYGREDGHMDDGFAPDDVQWVRNGEEIGRERLYGLLANIKEALGKENVDTPEMDAFLKKLYEHNYLFFKSIWWYFYTPSLQIPKYAHDKGLRDNIDPNNSYGDPLKNDEQIREKVLPNLKECLDRARKP